MKHILKALSAVVALVAAVAFSGSGRAQEVECEVNINTGFSDVNGAVLMEGEPDDSYTVDDGLGPVPALTGGASTGFPIPPWIANDDQSLWISNAANSLAAPGLYLYEIRITIPGNVDASRLVISGRWAVDDQNPEIDINDQVTGITTAGFGTYTPFPANAGLGLFQTGENIIRFQVQNGVTVDPTNPSGLRVEACVGTLVAVSRPNNLSTGFNNTTATLVPDGGQDPNYTLTGPPGSGIGPMPAIAVAAPPCPIPPWVANSVSARWIGVGSAGCSDPPGNYSFKAQVNVAGLEASRAVLRGSMAADDQVSDIIVNGASTGFVSGGFDLLQPFPVALGRGLFKAGANTVEFIVTNGGDAANPMGLYVDARVVEGPPDVNAPASVLLLDTGFDNANRALIDNDQPDDNYVLIGPPGSDLGPEFATVVNDTVFPIPPWIGTTALSKWIGTRETSSNGPPGDYSFTIKVSILPGVDASQARLVGKWTTDNPGKDIKVNGTSTGATATGNFPAFENIPPGAGLGLFHTGENTVEFIVNNAPPGINPVGLRVEAVVGIQEVDPSDLSTGLSDRGIGPLPAGYDDPRYVVTGPAGSGIGPKPAVSAADGAIPGLANSGASRWIGLDGTTTRGPQGQYLYELHFILPAPFNPLRTVLAGRWAAAGSGADIRLNGTALGISASGSNDFTPFPAQAGKGLFVLGDNVLAFLVDNPAEGPTGLRVEARLEMTAPEANPLDISTGFNQETAQTFGDDEIDADYIVTTPDLISTEATVLADDDFPIPPWIASTPTSRWISVAAPDGNSLAGDHRFAVTVKLTAAQAAEAFIAGVWAADNSGVDVVINNGSTGIANNGGFGAFTSFPADAGKGLFVAGENTIEFIVNNAPPDGNPMGLRVDAVIQAPQGPPAKTFRRGDVDNSGAVDISDPINELHSLFLGDFDITCQDAADFDDSGEVDITDAINSLLWQFGGGLIAPPPGPFNCGADLTPDKTAPDIGCESYVPVITCQ
ncbi:MAG: hypothetical protein HY717_22465 [Planctomycetes bacterium]|nr:hypothetical protein [Planctomycetota bacterium]